MPSQYCNAQNDRQCENGSLYLRKLRPLQDAGHSGHIGGYLWRWLLGAGSIDASLYRAWGRLGYPVSVLHPRPAVRAASRNIAAYARFLDGVLGRDWLCRPGDDGPA